jgi:glutamate-1-semialdehyde aminotransferase
MRDSSEYGAAYVDHNLPPRLPGGEVRTLWLTIENRGTRAWPPGAVRLAIDLDGGRVTHVELPQAVGVGERVTLHWVFRTAAKVGRHQLKCDLVEPDGKSFESRGVPPLRVAFHVDRPVATPTGRLRDRVLETHARCWLPCDGVSWSSGGNGPYPQFAREARGCWLIDVEGRRYVDYLMGWGSALLGYAPDRVQRAIEAALRSAPVLTLTHELMPEVADMLRERFPGAEAVTFGKNGSDVCTAAVRLARVHTGRPVILSCGYHGWQDWYVERLGFGGTGVPPRNEPLLVPFEPQNLAQVAQLLEAHRGRVAAVILEPAGVLESIDGPIRAADPAYLRELILLAHREGALVIFDEIMTGFRHLGGSVQQAAGVVPDLTCLGKALTGGMPLSALVGRREVFDSSIGKIHYEPTFKGEVYSLAAAREALNIYREQDIPTRVWGFGNRLREAVNAICRDLRVPAEVIGPPYRMLLVFSDGNRQRRTLMRTLVQQELLKSGVLTTQNLLLPSAAHDDEALDVTRRGFAHALGVLAQATEEDRFASYLEVPPLPG